MVLGALLAAPSCQWAGDTKAARVSFAALKESVEDVNARLTSAVEEGSAYGAALLAGVAAGVFADVHEAVARCVEVSDVVEPDARWRAAYESGYLRFRSLYPVLRPLEVT